VVSLFARRRRSAPHAPAGPGPCTVRTDDGVELHVEVDGDRDAALTVVLTHGFTARLGEWDPQRAALRGRARLVLWDHRGHGRSGWTSLRKATIDRTGRDLAEVLDATTPTGPVVLAGHSMGGMSILALARRRPELFGERVAGVFLLATSAGGPAGDGLLGQGRLGRFVGLARRLGLLALFLAWLRLTAPVLERFRRRGSALGRWYTRRYLFGTDDAEPARVREVQEMLEETPYPVTTAFYASLLALDETAALPVLGRVPVTVLVGDADRLTPAAHSRRLARLIGPAAELVVVPGAGHSVNLSRPAVVDAALLALLDRVRRQLPQAG
jgi:pimeloyl-ACP methyl ester carboxylesterase